MTKFLGVLVLALAASAFSAAPARAWNYGGARVAVAEQVSVDACAAPVQLAPAYGVSSFSTFAAYDVPNAFLLSNGYNSFGAFRSFGGVSGFGGFSSFGSPFVNVNVGGRRGLRGGRRGGIRHVERTRVR